MSINLNNADTQQMNLDTRLAQLDAAIKMELWQEAYKAVEDIHGLMTMSKKVFQPKMMANYYQKLALVFWKSGNHLFHAAAVFKHFQLTREMKKNISTEEHGKMASLVLAACLAVPVPSHHPEFDKVINIFNLFKCAMVTHFGRELKYFIYIQIYFSLSKLIVHRKKRWHV